MESKIRSKLLKLEEKVQYLTTKLDYQHDVVNTRIDGLERFVLANYVKVERMNEEQGNLKTQFSRSMSASMPNMDELLGFEKDATDEA
jgi:hypothetical protein